MDNDGMLLALLSMHKSKSIVFWDQTQIVNVSGWEWEWSCPQLFSLQLCRQRMSNNSLRSPRQYVVVLLGESLVIPDIERAINLPLKSRYKVYSCQQFLMQVCSSTFITSIILSLWNTYHLFNLDTITKTINKCRYGWIFAKERTTNTHCITCSASMYRWRNPGKWDICFTAFLL